MRPRNVAPSVDSPESGAPSHDRSVLCRLDALGVIAVVCCVAHGGVFVAGTVASVGRLRLHWEELDDDYGVWATSTRRVTARPAAAMRRG